MDRMTIRSLIAWFALTAFAVAAGQSAVAQRSAPGSRHALVIYSYSRLLPWENRVMRGLDAVLGAIALERRPYLYEESLDSGRVGMIDDLDAWRSYVEEKYRDVRLDAVITESQQAASLLLSFPELFPGAERYVLHYAEGSSLGNGNGAERRFSSSEDMERALLLIPSVRPGTKRVVVVTDRTVNGMARVEQIGKIAGRLEGLAVDIWDAFTEEELLSRSAGLPNDAAIMYLPVQRDRNDAPLVPGVVGERLAASSSVPVFTHFDSLLGSGIVGGYLVSGDLLGRLIGEIAARGDMAVPVSQRGYAEATMGYYFDARALERWGIRRESLPSGSVVLYDEEGFWDRYWYLMVAGAVVFVLETLLILALVRSSSQRARAMKALAVERSRLEATVEARTADLSAANDVLVREVRDRERAEAKAVAMATEKAMLLRELQHRVKNSLSIIVSLIGLEADKSVTDELRASLDTLESRVSALAALYDILYDTGGIERLPLEAYLDRVVDAAAESLGVDVKGIRLTRDIAPVAMDMKRAVSLGLIVNELVTDCLKYAFPDGTPGTVRVSLRAEAGRYLLIVEDDGVGLPEGFDPDAVEGFGFKLVRMMTRQLRGEFAWSSGAGTRFSLSVPAADESAAG